jgi:DMSO/TMAO reductase YedYZ molybdopterin-dependent catalytic subunit
MTSTRRTQTASTRIAQLPGSFARRRDETLADPRHSTRTAAVLGISLGACFTVCFLTGLYSHFAQHPPEWFSLPAGPSGLYRLTQGLHVATGIAAVPLLLAKLWSVYPRFFQWPIVQSVPHLIERLSLVPLVAGALFMLFSGVANIDLWYPLPLFFPTGHYWVAWLTIGAMVMHVGAKLTITRQALRRPTATGAGVPALADDAVTRRRFLTMVGGTSALLTIVTIGQTVEPLQRLALLAPRRPDTGDSGFPVNNTAAEAHVVDQILDPAYRLRIDGAVPAAIELSLAELHALPHRQAKLPIACVEGWSASRVWGGVALRDLLDRAGAAPGASVTVHSFENGLYASSDVNGQQASHPDTLLATAVDGQPLSPDHGYPVRLIGPNRPGVMQTKWLRRIEVHA